MIIVREIGEIRGEVALAATVGFFDGVHRGHRYLIDTLRDAARARCLPSAVITFLQHPRAVLQADYQPRLLNSHDEKLCRLSGTGVDYCILLDFTVALSRLTAREFILSVLSGRWNVKTLLAGYDHRFGRNRTEGFGRYALYAASCDMEVLEAPPLIEDGVAVSSSEVRKQLSAGKVEEAARLLTYPYSLKGHVVHGERIGRTIGFPTANIMTDDPLKMVPGEGVYAVEVYLDNTKYRGMLYIGRRPTLDAAGHTTTMEVHILDFTGDIYMRTISVSFIGYVRSDIRFSSLEELGEQLKRDRETVSAILTGARQ
ncbi:MAG: riboflavin biosynthesis protein RibF [Tannerellaceae bacterium]|jgi:riboflavin kinase/FMN adenylyltransferase|nr:riboflavin biosynthesis protein RibF [Tannerellaceae bacterium]